MQRIRLLLVDAQPIYRHGLRSLLSREPDLLVVGEAADGRSATALIQDLQPDIVLTDPPSPGGTGLEPSYSRRSALNAPKVIVLTAQRDSTSAFVTFKHGARGYLVKDASPEEIVRAVREVAAGGAVLDPLVAADVLDEMRLLWKIPAHPPLSLSERQIRILVLVAQGYSNREIGIQLNLAEKTIRNALRDLFQMCDFTSRAQAAAFAVQIGLHEVAFDCK
jgi:DNA-binding NarL/FixJ family response regulator